LLLLAATLLCGAPFPAAAEYPDRPQWSPPEAAAAVIKADVAKWNEVIRRANLLPK
jgi:hypothetical protein